MKQKIKVRYCPDGIHLFNRKTGVNILLDEMLLPKENWSAAPRQVSIALTNACDLECHYCYAPKNPARLDFHKLSEWLLELDSNGCMGIGFGGGEPTLYPKLIELCSFASKETSLALTMTTHAHHLTDKLLSQLEGNLHFIRISMDGTYSTYEQLRKKSFNQLLERMKVVRKITKFGINYVVNEQTIDELDSAIQIAFEMGAKEFLLLPEEPTRLSEGIGSKTMQKLEEWIVNYQGDMKLSISEKRGGSLPFCNPFSLEKGLASYAHIDAFGTLKLSSYDASGISLEKNVSVLDAIKKLNELSGENVK